MSTQNVAGMLDLETLEEEIACGRVDTVLTVIPDLYGRLVGKRITGPFFIEQIAGHGMHVCDYLLACDMEMDPVPGYDFASWQTGYGDVLCRPDLSTLRLAAWQDRTALVLCDVWDEAGAAQVSVAPRTILQRQIARAADAGLLLQAGNELEFFLFRETYRQASEQHYHELQTFGNYIEDYHILQGTRAEPIVGEIRRALDASGVPVEFSKGEWGAGQQEINLRYGALLETADRQVVYKHAAKEICDRHGASLTFMAKWHAEHAGNSCHLHTSLWDLAGMRSLVASADDALAFADTFRHFLGGLLAHAREFSLFFAPYVNSYKRYRAGSFAPTGIAWSRDNRTVGFRCVGRGDSLRIENRIPGADANPYLALAATVAAGLDGIEQRTEPPPQFEGDLYQASEIARVPTSLPEAIAALEASELARAAFGDEVVDHYLHFARTEQRKFEETVTCWERQRYFERA